MLSAGPFVTRVGWRPAGRVATGPGGAGALHRWTRGHLRLRALATASLDPAAAPAICSTGASAPPRRVRRYRRRRLDFSACLSITRRRDPTTDSDTPASICSGATADSFERAEPQRPRDLLVRHRPRGARRVLRPPSSHVSAPPASSATRRGDQSEPAARRQEWCVRGLFRTYLDPCKAPTFYLDADDPLACRRPAARGGDPTASGAPGTASTWLAGLILALSTFMGWYAGSGVGVKLAVIGWHTGTIGKLVVFIGLATVSIVAPPRGGDRASRLDRRRASSSSPSASLATVFVLIRVITIPDAVLPADDRGIGIWISLVAARRRHRRRPPERRRRSVTRAETSVSPAP